LARKLFKKRCTKFYQNRSSLIEDITKKNILVSFFLDTLYSAYRTHIGRMLLAHAQSMYHVSQKNCYLIFAISLSNLNMFCILYKSCKQRTSLNFNITACQSASALCTHNRHAASSQDIISANLWLPNIPDFSAVNYRIWGSATRPSLSTTCARCH